MRMTHWQLPSKGAEANRIRGTRKNRKLHFIASVLESYMPEIADAL